MSFATVAEFLARLDPQVAQDLSAASGAEEPDQARLQAALDDATAELQGYLPRVPTAHLPTPETLRVHCVKVATYLLTLSRPGKEFEQIRNAYADTIAFYKGLTEPVGGDSGGASAPLGGSACVPESAFNDQSLKGLA